MIIVVGQWKQKVVRFVIAVVIVGLFAAAIPLISGVFYDKVPVFTGWSEDEHPSGNPMRVEKDTSGDNFNDKMDQFVIKVQNFYYQEKE